MTKKPLHVGKNEPEPEERGESRGCHPSAGLCRPPRVARRALYYFFRFAGVARALRARLTPAYWLPPLTGLNDEAR